MKYVLCLVAAAFAVEIVFATSWTNKEKERGYKIEKVKSETFDWTKIGVTCQDELADCKDRKQKCSQKIVRMKCKETCGECRLESPRSCRITKYGCCWDNTTIAQSEQQLGCPPCVDKYSECTGYKMYCDEPNIRSKCPVTCGVPCNDCHDDKNQEMVCPMYKKYKFCKISQIVEKICKKTCGFC